MLFLCVIQMFLLGTKLHHRISYTSLNFLFSIYFEHVSWWSNSYTRTLSTTWSYSNGKQMNMYMLLFLFKTKSSPLMTIHICTSGKIGPVRYLGESIHSCTFRNLNNVQRYPSFKLAVVPTFRFSLQLLLIGSKRCRRAFPGLTPWVAQRWSLMLPCTPASLRSY